MPREIKTPLRYQTGSEKRQPLRTGKRGRPRLVSNESKPKDTKNATTSSEPVIIADDDDDSDVEIIDVTKPPAKKKKTNYDPDWGIEKKGSSGKAKIKSKEKSAKTSLLATPSRTSESSKVVETQRPSAISISKKCTAPTPSSFIELFMECKDEPLSPAQIQSAQKEQTFYDMSQTLVKAAREGRLIFSPEGGVIILDKPCSMQLAPQAPQTPVLTSSMPIAAHTPPLINTGKQIESLAANEKMSINEEKSSLSSRRKKMIEISSSKDVAPLSRTNLTSLKENLKKKDTLTLPREKNCLSVLHSSDALTLPSQIVKTSISPSALDKQNQLHFSTSEPAKTGHITEKSLTSIASYDGIKFTAKKKAQIKRGLSKSKLRNLSKRHLISLRPSRSLRDKIQRPEKYAAYLAEEKIRREKIKESNKRRKELSKNGGETNSNKKPNTPR